MDVFALRNKVVDDYSATLRASSESVTAHREIRTRQVFVRALWPDPILQLNPAYEPGETLDGLASKGILRNGTSLFFRRYDGGPLKLYRHQREAIDIAQKGEPYVVTTGTGSGKSLTYLVPIYDHILRNQPEKPGVRAIIVYPMKLSLTVNGRR